MNDKKYDIILFGATGFTGQIIAKYLAEHTSEENISWAIAGRDTTKLQNIAAGLSGNLPGIVVADVKDQESLSAMAGSTKILMNAVGPFNWYGKNVVEACIHNQTHYLDITGEPSFVNTCYKHYHTLAEQNKVTIINCCGFDSIPADFATWLTVKKLPVDQPKAVRAFIRTNATFSGGTLTTAINALHQQAKGNKTGFKVKKNPLSPKIKKNIHFNKDVGAWVLPMPVVDPHIVKRSAYRLKQDYGDAFSYGQFFVRSSFIKVVKTVMPIVVATALVRFKFFRDRMFKKFQPGTGPSEERRNESKFEVICIGETADKKVKTIFSGGDPGYNETAKMFSESAFCLLNKLKNNHAVHGVLTPVEALGMDLVTRLRQRGMHIE